jgi:hypothetical protein
LYSANSLKVHPSCVYELFSACLLSGILWHNVHWKTFGQSLLPTELLSSLACGAGVVSSYSVSVELPISRSFDQKGQTYFACCSLSISGSTLQAASVSSLKRCRRLEESPGTILHC